MSSKTEIGIKLSLAGAQQVEAGLRKVGGSLGGLDGAVAAARQSLMTLVPALGAAFAADKMAQMLKGVNDAANQIDRLARLADSAPQEFQRYAAAAKTVGVDMEKFADITKDVQDKIGDFMQTGGGELKDFFEKIAPKVGVTAEQFKHLSGPQALQLFYSSLQKANLSQKETVYWMEAIGDDSSKLIPLLANNGAEFKRLGDRAAASGAQMSDYLIAASKQLTEQTGEMDNQLKAAKNTLAEQLFPALTETARALVEFGRDGSAAELVADGLRVVFETVAITGANVAYVLKMTGRELGGLAAQAALVMSGEFKAAGTVGDLMKQDAAAARADLETFERRILNARQTSKAMVDLSEALKSAKAGSDSYKAALGMLNDMQSSGAISTAQMEAVLRGIQPAAQVAGKGLSGMGLSAEEAKKAAEAAKKSADELKKSYQSALDGAASQARDLTAESDKLNAAEKKLIEIIASPAWAKWNATQRETVRTLYERNSATIKAQELAKADEKWLKETADDNLKFAESAFSAADAAEEQARQQLLANEAIGLTGTALADLEAIRLRDAAAEKTRLAAIMDGIDPGIAESYRRQAAAMTELAASKQAGAAKQATADANEAMQEDWKKTVEKYEDVFRDGFAGMLNNGKAGWSAFTKSLSTTFKTAVANEIYKSLAKPFVVQVIASLAGVTGLSSVAGVANAATGGGGSLLGTASSAANLANLTGLGSTLGALGAGVNAFSTAMVAGAQSMVGISGTAAQMATSLSQAGYWAGSSAATAASTAGASLGASAAAAAPYALAAYAAIKVAGLDKRWGGDPDAYLVQSAAGKSQPYQQSASTAFGQIGFANGSADILKNGSWIREYGETENVASEAMKGTLDAFTALDAAIAATLSQGEIANVASNLSGWYRKSWSFEGDMLGDWMADRYRAVFASIDGELGTLFEQMTFDGAALPGVVDLFVVLNSGAKNIAGMTQEVGRLMDGTSTYIRTGETAAQTVTRLSGNLSTVNAAFDVLGQALYQMSLGGAEMAQQLVDLMGGTAQFQATTTAYYQAYYTDAERTATATRQLTASLSALGLSLPSTRDAYRDLVEAQDLSTEAGRATYAALMGLSGAFAAITPSAADLAAQLQTAQDAVAGLFAALTQSVSEGGSAIAGARQSINGTGLARTYGQLTAAVGGINTTGPSSAAMDAATAALAKTRERLASASSAVDQETRFVAQANGRIREYSTLLEQYGTWDSYSQMLRNEIAGWEWLRDTSQSRLDKANGQKSSEALQLKADTTALEAQQSAYLKAVTAWVATAETSVRTLDLLREETVAYYESQRELASIMQVSASGVRESIKLAKQQTLAVDQSMAERQADFGRIYSMALSTTGATKAGYADQLASALPQLSQDLASMSASRADWAMSVAQLSAKAAKVADQLDSTAPKNYQAEANTLLSAIDAKLLAVNASATSAEAVISKAVNDGATRTAIGLQQIINALQGKSVSAFAKGGVFTNSVVGTPTLAPMALFGEAGDEAIMPLSRGPGGVLGVRAFGVPGGDRPDSSSTERLLRDLVAEVQRLNAQLQDAKRTSDQARQENNVGNSKIADSTDRLARLVERWDAVGLPATAAV